MFEDGVRVLDDAAAFEVVIPCRFAAISRRYLEFSSVPFEVSDDFKKLTIDLSKSSESDKSAREATLGEKIPISGYSIPLGFLEWHKGQR